MSDEQLEIEALKKRVSELEKFFPVVKSRPKRIKKSQREKFILKSLSKTFK